MATSSLQSSRSPTQAAVPSPQISGITPKAEFPLVTIVVPSWNSEDEIGDFLESLLYQTYPRSSIELIVIDNGSTDGSVGAIRSWYARQQTCGWRRLELITLPSNEGIAHAYNLGYEKSSASAFAILRGEADVVFEPDVVEKLCGVLMNETTIGVVGARGLLSGTEPPQLDHAAGYVNWWNGRLTTVDPVTLVDCDSVMGPTFITRKTCLDGMDFFFPADRFLADELELCTRVKRRGYRVVCEPAAVSHHKGARSTSQLNRTRFGYIAYRESTLFYLKYNSFPRKLVWLAWNFAYCLIQAFKGNIVPLLGLRDGIRWWLANRPSSPPDAVDGESLSAWLAG